MLLRTVWLSLDPYMRGRMSDAPSYSPPVEIGAVMVGGTVSRVETSRHPDYKEGEWVLGYSGWQEYELSDGQGLVKLGENPSHPSWALGVLGMPGFTAYMGLLDIGQPQAGNPRRGGGHGAGWRNGGADRKNQRVPGHRRGWRGGEMPSCGRRARFRRLSGSPCG